MLHYLTKNYKNRILILEAHIQETEKYYKHLRGNRFRKKRHFPLFTERKLNELRYQY